MMKKEQHSALNAQMKNKVETKQLVKKTVQGIEHEQYLANIEDMKSQQEYRAKAKEDVTKFWKD